MEQNQRSAPVFNRYKSRFLISELTTAEDTLFSLHTFFKLKYLLYIRNQCTDWLPYSRYAYIMAWVAEIMTFVAAWLCAYTKYQEDLFIREDIKAEKNRKVQQHLIALK